MNALPLTSAAGRAGERHGRLEAAPAPISTAVLSPAVVRRTFATLPIAFGLLVGALQAPFAPAPERTLLFGLGVASVMAGGLLWILAARPSRRVLLESLLPAFLAVVALHGAIEPRAILPVVFGLLAFVWIGLALPRWTAVRQAPFLAGALALPPLADGATSLLPLTHVLPVVLVAVLAGELLGLMTERAAVVQGSLRRTRELLRRREAQYRSLVQNASDLITVVDPDGTVRYQTGSVAQVLGYDPTELENRRVERWVHPDDAPRLLAFLRGVVDEPEATASVECRLLHRDGSWRHCATSAVNLLENRHVAGIVLSTRDISERKALEDELTRRAFHDPLTGLANRTFFVQQVQEALAEGQRAGAPVAVLFLDLDGFKTVNDSLGHTAGDQLLVCAARRLSSSLRPGDSAARLGGDEFAVLVQNVLQPGDAIAVAERLLGALREPFEILEKEVIVRASVGIARGETFTEDAHDLLRHADMAMYAAKANGKNGYAVFQPHMHTDVVARLELQTDLHRAFDREEFAVVYQPIVDLRTGRVAGVEALLRWNHPERGTLHPGSFLEMTEETGLIEPLGRWVLRQACAQARSWQALETDEPPLVVSVNLSATQLRQPTFAAEVASILRETRLPARSLVLEITESVLLDDRETTLETVRRLHDLGVRMALDDFGTGYSSLAYIRRLGIELLKIDRSFLQSIGTEAEDPALTQAVVQLARSLGLQTIAEGMENARQLQFLRDIEADFGQGYYFAGPLSAEAMDALLNRRRPLEDALLDPTRRSLGVLWEEGNGPGALSAGPPKPSADDAVLVLSRLSLLPLGS